MANIYFKHLSLSNFMSYEKAEIDLNRIGSILVTGENNNPEDKAKSNGCGKSSLFSALSWCLTGETVSGAKDVSNIYKEGKTEVSVIFDIDNIEYEIRRTKNPSNLFIFVNGENKSGKGIRDTERLICDYISQLSSILINSVIILGQGLPQRFTNNTPSGRKEILEKLSNSDFMILDLKDKLLSRKNELVNKQRKLQDDNLKLTTSINLNTSNINLLLSELDSLDNKDNLIYQLNSIHNKIVDTDNELVQLTDDRNRINNELKDNLLLRNNISYEYSNALSSIEQESTEDKENKLIELKSSYSSLNNKINDLDSVVDICPTCGQKLKNVVKLDTSNLKIELNNIKVEIDNLVSDINQIKFNNNSKISECKNLFNDKLTSLNSDIKAIENNLSLTIDKLNTLNDTKNTLNRNYYNIKCDIDTLEEKIKYRKDKIDELENTNKNLQSTLYDNNKQLEIIDERLDINSKMQTLIKRDFRGYLLNNIISFIENKAKMYSYELFGTDKFRFCLEGNNINISYDNKDYNVLSGGEKQKLDIIIQFAIRDMLCTFLDFSSNILVLDEITDSLDSIGVENVFSLIDSKLRDVESVYIISHHVDELEISTDDKILIIKGSDKISRIV